MCKDNTTVPHLSSISRDDVAYKFVDDILKHMNQSLLFYKKFRAAIIDERLYSDALCDELWDEDSFRIYSDYALMIAAKQLFHLHLNKTTSIKLKSEYDHNIKVFHEGLIQKYPNIGCARDKRKLHPHSSLKCSSILPIYKTI